MNWDKALSTPDANATPIPAETLADHARTRIRKLAELSDLDYELCREEEAKALGIRVSLLDREVDKARKIPEKEDPDPFEDLEPWPHPVDGTELIEEIRATLNRFCVLPEHSDVLIAA